MNRRKRNMTTLAISSKSSMSSSLPSYLNWWNSGYVRAAPPVSMPSPALINGLADLSAYLDPSFEAMVRCQLRFSQEGYDKLSGVQRYFADHIREDYANGALDGQVEAALDEMKELSIYGP